MTISFPFSDGSPMPSPRKGNAIALSVIRNPGREDGTPERHERLPQLSMSSGLTCADRNAQCSGTL